jgi:hypothetical protein
METPENPDRIQRAFADDDAFMRALQQAHRQALLDHKRADLPIVIVENGRVVRIPPDQIVIPPEAA